MFDSTDTIDGAIIESSGMTDYLLPHNDEAEIGFCPVKKPCDRS